MEKIFLHASHSLSAAYAVSQLLQQLRNCMRHDQSLLCTTLALDMLVDVTIVNVSHDDMLCIAALL